ncbi:maleylacetoacetate isomerase [Photobacterium sp. DNB23_23_1]|uniref:Maleylacetoacetate isomerase n=1 Tax=Photobacterium pectinilyticum TaxID=2906793 RepID=A0ABT1N3B4_9GAMM|nr:maleylacetoacetate isomerase [Photobacterium sp. ZSDE20]MCQ1059223.1 maleylacetoacetate isomerase [Photobacterium sp. ZSDE20]MDD1824544.1 maleylacetoacetate isomerase [Photobacterium sp. ZSDE20]
MKLYDYYRSSASYRVRIALNMKGLSYEQVVISLLDKEQNSAAYSALNPNQLVPGFCRNTDNSEKSSSEDTAVLGQSLAIIEYIDECYPEPPLLPSDPWHKAQCREIALIVACDIHPLNNLRVLNYLNSDFGVNQNEKMIWYHHWLKQGLQSLENLSNRYNTLFTCTDTPSLADICLIPQLYNAKRFGFETNNYPRLLEVEQRCLALAAFQKAHPDNQ